MRLPPPDVVASWPAPNYVDPETRGPALLITVLIIMPIALVTLACRLYVRMYLLRRAGWDDWLMIAAAVSWSRLIGRSMVLGSLADFRLDRLVPLASRYAQY